MEKVQVKKRKKKKTIAELVREAKRKKREDSSSATSSTADSDASDDSSSDDYDMTHKEVPINLPEPLRAKLEDDCYFISYQNQLIKLPCTPTILTVLESYVEYFASKHPPQDIVWPPTVLGGISAMAKEPIPPPPLPQHNFELVKEVMDGLRVLFDFTVGKNLLYASEKYQYNKLVAANYMPGHKPPETPLKKRGRGRPPKVAKTPSPPVLEPQAKPDFPKTKESPASEKQESDKEEEDEREETPPRRITRRLSCSALNPASVQTETRLRQRSESGPRSLQSTRKTRSESVTSDSSGGHPTPRPGLRHSARLSSHGTAPPEIPREIALPTRERKKSESDPDAKTHLKEKRDKHVNKDKEKVMAEQSNKEKIVHNKGSEDKENCKQTNSDQGSSVTESSTKGIYTCKLMADDSNYDGRIPPVKIYGAQHLLRLFVKLPQILGKMDLPPKKLKPLVKHLEMFLKYLSAPEQLEAFFPDSAYQKAYKL
ncbi:MSL complex subunit 3B-like isoform X2 [Amphiura filiformis]